ncbi:MAG TPA: L-aspartate oxidase [Caldilineaceae bacterium]|nr:L-aspartate oxidase [Caldilineaceae bacterium]
MSDAHQTDVLILGTGVAGATVALTLADAGVPVTLVTRAQAPEESNTLYAQGGIIYTGPNDSPDHLAEDILRAGAGHSYPPAVRLLAEEGPGAVRRLLLERAGIAFDRTADGGLSLALEGGHSLPRIIHAADATGKAIEIGLLNVLREHPNVTLLTGHTAVDLLTPSHHARDRLAVYDHRSCVGAYVLDQASRRVRRILARATVLATGGLGQIFLRTTNPPGARGDGIAMAQRAGVRIINAEFVQFHPTAFYHRQAARFLISEAVRGAGARLVDAQGRPFMEKYDPEWRDLSPRDVVARSIHTEMLKHDAPCVYLDLRSYVPEAEIRSHFPTILARCLEYGVDITRDLVPVVPAAHYFCGGVWVDAWGQTSLRNLYAVGEVACTGVHGANRLASTSLLEGLVWGERAARHILGRLVEGLPLAHPEEIAPWQDTGIEEADPALISQDMASIKHIMWNYVGLVRSTARLERALRDLRQLDTEIEQFYRRTCLSDPLIGLRNAVKAALVVAEAAWQNKRSLGCHYRES